MINTPRKFVPIPSKKRVASLPLSPRASKKLYPTHKWAYQVDKWIIEESIEFYEIRESSQAQLRDHILKDPTDWVISLLVLRIARHDDSIHRTEMDLISPRRDVRILTDRV